MFEVWLLDTFQSSDLELWTQNRFQTMMLQEVRVIKYTPTCVALAPTIFDILLLALICTWKFAEATIFVETKPRLLFIIIAAAAAATTTTTATATATVYCIFPNHFHSGSCPQLKRKPGANRRKNRPVK